MPAPLPNFVRRAWRLLEARRALIEGAPERALEHLRDPVLNLSAEADRLRERSLSALYRDAAQRAQQGRTQSVARLLSVVAGEDPSRAQEWGQQLGPRSQAHAPLPDSRSEERESHMLGLLSRLRSQGSADSPGAAGEERSPVERPPSETFLPTSEGPPRDSSAPTRLHLAVDDGGELFCVCGDTITLGHARLGLADVPLFADLAGLHARLERRSSFHGGSSWTLVPIGDVDLGVSGRKVGPAGEALVDGDEVLLGPKVSFRFVAPELSTSSVRLDLLHGLEAEGAQRVLIWVAGSEGRIRIGPKEERTVPVAGLEHDVEMSWDASGLEVSCSGGVRTGSGQKFEERIELPWPLASRCQLVAGARPSTPVPFGLALEPVDSAGPSSARGSR
ncbi:MAG: hypothetical protein ACI8QC_004380 [Planctomycetota bacterium]|jgi:hypothetical protein